MPDMAARNWIMKNCRTSEPLKPLGPQPQLHEEWVKPAYNYELPPTPPEPFAERDFVRVSINSSYQILKKRNLDINLNCKQ